MTTINLDPHPTGGHDADHTVAVAGAVADAIRALNYATLAENADDAVPYPATAYDVVGRLHAAAASTDQLIGQLADRLGRIDEDYAAALYVSHGPHVGDSESAMNEAVRALARVRRVAEDYADALAAAHEALSPIGVRLPDDDD
jgi:hypothetical protein